MKTRLLGSVTGAVLAGLISTPGVLAQSVEEFYSGNTVTIMVGYSPGGAYDTYARAMARHMGRHIPGNPGIIVQNMPGAGSMLLANHLANVAPRDGTVFGSINRGIPLEPLFGRAEAEFDATELNYIGSTDIDTTACVVRADAPVQTIEDLREAPLVVGASGAGSDTSIIPSYFNEVLDLQFNVIRGYPGSSDYMLALERNEVQGVCLSFQSVAQHEMYSSGQLNILFQASVEPDSALPEGTPVIMDYIEDPDARAITQLMLERSLVGRPYVAPPEVPEDRLSALRTAFMATMEDPAFVEEMTQQGRPIGPTSGEDLQELIAQIYAEAEPETVEQLIAMLGRLAGEGIQN